MEDLREAIEAAITTAEENTPAPAPAPAPEEPQSQPATPAPAPAPATPEEPSEGLGGAPAPAPAPAPQEPKAEEPKPAEPKSESLQEPKEAKEHVTERAPASWTPEAKEKWATIPLEARQEIVRREREVARVMQETAGAREVVQNLQQIVQPHMQRLQANNIHPLQTINNLLQADAMLASAPQPQRAAFLAKIIQDYQIDINELDTALAGQLQGQRNPALDIQAAVQQAIQPMMAPIQSWQQQQAQAAIREQEETLKAIQKMELDPKFEFFNDVRADMADLMDLAAKRGVALTLEEAYNKAILAHPEIGRVVQERKEQEAARQALQRNQQAAQRAKSAAVSLGSVAPAAGSSQGGPMDLRSTIEAAFTAAGSGGRI